jgi:Insertion element 4 transposase N-terminal/Transposase DDE domain
LPDHGAIACPDDVSLTFPLRLIDEVIEQAGAAQKRRRLLPAAAVMIFVLGCALFSGEGYAEVARKLAGWLGPLAGRERWPVPGTSALAKARRRLGSWPLELLFSRLAGPLAGLGTPGAAAGFGRRLLLMSMDGTTLDVPCTAANIAAFGPPPSAPRGPGGYPQVRLLALIACGTRGLADAAMGPRRASEQDLARQVAARGALGPGDLVLADRNFAGHAVARPLTATGADVIIRARSSQSLPVLQALPDGSYRSVLPDPAASRRRHHRNGTRRRRGSTLPPDPVTLQGIPVRVISADITTRPARGQPRTTFFRLITTLLSPAEAPAHQIAALYAQRWEAETGFRELKTSLRGPGRILRSRDPAGVTQETWALLCAHQLISAARASAARTTGTSLDPDQISYTVTLRAIRRHILTGPPTTTTHSAIITEILAQPLPTRRHRSYPRNPHASPARRRQARATTGGPTTYTTTIRPTPHPTSQPNP